MACGPRDVRGDALTLTLHLTLALTLALALTLTLTLTLALAVQGFHTICTGASVIQYIPFLRRFMNLCGSADVSKASLTKLLRPSNHPYSVAHLVVGGIAEMFYGSQGVEQIVLAKRKGFVKLAMQTGAAIIPAYTFGTNQMFYRPCGPKSLLA